MVEALQGIDELMDGIGTEQKFLRNSDVHMYTTVCPGDRAVALLPYQLRFDIIQVRLIIRR